jgi:hypothetical protein
VSGRKSVQVKKTGAAQQEPASTAITPARREAPPVVVEALSGAGRPLDDETRAFMEPRLGHDFSKVRVHTDERAAESARSLNAVAYTVGDRIVFGAGQYSPSTAAGRGLLAHELTHVVQQQQSSGPALQRQYSGATDDPDRKTPDPNAIIPIDKFIEYIEAVELAYPKDKPQQVLTRVRQQYYSGIVFELLIPNAPTHEIGTKPHNIFGSVPAVVPRVMDSSRVEKDAYKHLTAQADENPTPELHRDNPSPYIKLANGEEVDAGHLLLGVDALLHPETDAPYTTYSVPNIDPSSWVADLGIASVMTTEEETLPLYKDARPKPKAGLAANYKWSAPEQDLLGDADSFGVHAQWQASPGQKLSEVLHAYYLGQQSKAPSVKRRWRTFCVKNGLMPKVSEKSVTWPPALRTAIILRVNFFSDLYAAGKLGAGFSVVTSIPIRREWPHTPAIVDKFLEYVRVNLVKEIASD